MAQAWDTIRNLSATTALIVAGGTAVWYFATLDMKVRNLERQMDAIHVAPSIKVNNSENVVNPLQEICAKLASAVMEANKSDSTFTRAYTASDLLSTAKKFGCTKD